MSNLDELIRTSLDARASHPVDVSRLATTAAEHGRRHRRRRRVAVALGATTLTALAVGTVAAAPSLLDDAGGRSGFAVDAALGTQLATALPATDEPGAVNDPARVGTEPLVVHFDAMGVTTGAQHYEWSTGAGYEQLEAGFTDEHLFLTIGADRAVLEAVSRQGGAGQVVWSEPVPGLVVRVQAITRAHAVQALAAMDLTVSQRIILPFAVGTVPADSRATGAYVGFIDGGYAQGGVYLRNTSGATLEVQAQTRPRSAGRTGNATIGGRAVFRYPADDEIELIEYPNLYLSIRIGKAYSGFTDADVTPMIASITATADMVSIATWPSSPLPG